MSFRTMPVPVLTAGSEADVKWPGGNKFLNGPFTPWTEESEAYDLEVISGQIPADLNGALFRIVSNPRFRPQDVDRYHWWDGDGGVAAIYLRDGRAAFRMRWVETDSMRFEMARGQAVYHGFVNGGVAGPQVTWYRADVTTGRVTDSHRIETGLPLMIHDFAVSEHYAVFLVTPTMLRLDLLARGLPGVVWDEAALPSGSQVILMNRDTHAVTWHEIGGMFAPTHYYNAYEDGDEVVIDTHRIDRLGNPAGQEPVSSHEWFPPAFPWQLRVNTQTGKVAQRTISGLAGEFARINDAYLGRRHRYGYFVTTRDLASDIMTDGLAKHDYDTGATMVVDGPDFLTSPSEPAFAPGAGAVAEDDGYLLALWWNRQTGLSELLIHDAASLSREPVARVRLPARVPFGFHGSWAGAAVLDRATAASREAVGTTGGEG